MLFFDSDKGSYRAYWKWVFEKCAERRSTYGTLSHASTFDPQFDEKVKSAIQRKELNPSSNYNDHLFLLAAEIQKHWCLRGCQEPAYLTTSDFVWSEKTEGRYKGRKCVRLKPSHIGQKKKHLSLSNVTRIDDGNKDAHIEVICTPDPYCLYRLLYKQVYVYLPPDCKGLPANRVLRRFAPLKTRMVCINLFAASNAHILL
jgi:hypothetical protein